MKAARLPTLALLVLAGCGEAEPAPLETSTVARTAGENFRHVAGELAEALAFLDGTRAGAFLGGCTDADVCTPAQPSEEAEAFATLLAERIFTEANVEARGPGSLTFRLRPEVVCADPEEDASCAFLDQIPIRLEVTSDVPGDLDVAILFGDARHRPLEIGLHAEELELQVDLGEVREVLVLAGVDTDELPAVMAGRLSLGVARHGAGDFTASLSVLEALSVRSHGFGPWQLELGEALPAIAARVRAADRKLTLRLGLGALALRGPIESFFGADDEDCPGCLEIEGAAPEGSAGLTLAGFAGEATLEVRGDGSERIEVRGLGLGADTAIVDVEGAPLFTVDLNPLSGRAVDLVAIADEAGVEVAFEPGVDLALGYYLSNIADRVEVPDWAMEETLHLRVEGASAPRLFLPAADDGMRPAIAEVLEGALLLGSDAFGELQVDEGMCLVSEPSENDHPFAGLAAGACP